jgi:asparagine synthase (glutamine-hydrolysing)
MHNLLEVGVAHDTSRPPGSGHSTAPSWDMLNPDSSAVPDSHFLHTRHRHWDIYAAAWPLTVTLTGQVQRHLDSYRSLGQCLRIAVPAVVIVRDRHTGAVEVYAGACGGSAIAFRATGQSLVVSSSLTALRDEQSAVDVEWLVNAMLGGINRAEGTPWTNIGRVPIGHVLRWSPGSQPTLEQWYVIDTERLEGTPEEWLEEYRARLDGVVALYRSETGELPVLMSAGLDSTTVAASAAVVQQSAGVQALIHVPVTAVPAVQGWVGSDLPDARSMTTRWPHLRLDPIQNLDDITAVDLLPSFVERFSLPMFNPANMVWIGEAQARAASRGQRRILTGSSGNRTYSYRLRRFVVPMLRNGQLGATIDALRHHANLTGTPLWRVVASHIRPDPVSRSAANTPSLRYLTPAARELFRPVDPQRALADFTPAHPLTGTVMSLPVDWDPECRLVDVLSAPELVGLVARLPPSMFVGEGRHRSFARRVMAGRVPDRIRLRSELGTQGLDSVYAYRRRPELQDTVRQVLADDRVTPVIDQQTAFAAWSTFLGDAGSGSGIERLLSTAFFLAGGSGATPQQSRRSESPHAGFVP